MCAFPRNVKFFFLMNRKNGLEGDTTTQLLTQQPCIYINQQSLFNEFSIGVSKYSLGLVFLA